MSLEARRWLLEPRASRERRLHIVVDPEKMKLTPEVCQALEALALELEKGIDPAKPVNCPEVEITQNEIGQILMTCTGVQGNVSFATREK